ncbi:MAG: hypothetical protein M1838_004561 [Thelocarpon superellum]|nr:MAG: hypothetical protein M1838_004561 [Thelocarpon superellum]
MSSIKNTLLAMSGLIMFTSAQQYLGPDPNNATYAHLNDWKHGAAYNHAAIEPYLQIGCYSNASWEVSAAWDAKLNCTTAAQQVAELVFPGWQQAMNGSAPTTTEAVTAGWRYERTADNCTAVMYINANATVGPLEVSDPFNDIMSKCPTTTGDTDYRANWAMWNLYVAPPEASFDRS